MMANLESILKEVFTNHPKAIVHMRKQFQNGQFGLVLGSGVSKRLGVPGWKALNRCVAKDPDVCAPQLIDSAASETVITQRLYEHYKSKKYAESLGTDIHDVKFNLRVYKGFNQILMKHLYANPPDNRKRIKDVHPYLGHYVSILKNTNLTINYNFDSYIERMLLEERTEEEKKRSRGYDSVTDPRIPFRKDRQVIYHPNGFLPREPMESTRKLVFSESEFADQLIGVMTGHYSPVIHHFCNNTCLLIGLSLDDPTLKHVLRLAVRMNPGRCHYYVHYRREDEEIDPELKKAIFAANFETYNLFTMFLGDEELAALGTLIESGYFLTEKKDSDVALLATQSGGIPLTYCYYVVGAIGVGKSTTIAHFRDLTTYDEWFEPRELDLGKEPEGLDHKRIQVIDKWISRQFTLKNHKLSEEASGIVLIDRCPLDPITFTPHDEWAKKADYLLREVTCDGATKIVPGHIILLLDDPAILELRLLPGAKEYSADRLDQLQKDILKIYTDKNISRLDAKYMTTHEIIKSVAKIIHTEDYRVIDVQKKIEEIKNG